MQWPKKIDTREMLTKETPPNAFLMVRFKCFFFFNEKHCHCNSICFKSFLQLFFIYRRDGPLENLWGGGGGGEVPKKYSRKGKLNEKKNSYTPVNP